MLNHTFTHYQAQSYQILWKPQYPTLIHEDTQSSQILFSLYILASHKLL